MDKSIKRYSEAFKRFVVREYEAGTASIGQLRAQYGIGGNSTIQGWIRTYGRAGLRHQVLRIQTPEEADQRQVLRREVQRLREALAQTLLDKLAAEQCLALYQEAFGTELAKKNGATSSKPSTTPPTRKDTQ